MNLYKKIFLLITCSFILPAILNTLILYNSIWIHNELTFILVIMIFSFLLTVFVIFYKFKELSTLYKIIILIICSLVAVPIFFIPYAIIVTSGF